MSTKPVFLNLDLVGGGADKAHPPFGVPLLSKKEAYSLAYILFDITQPLIAG